MKYTEIIKAIAKNTNKPEKEISRVLKEFKNIVIKEVAEGNEVNILGFGKFYRIKMNPRELKLEGKTYKVPARFVPKFKAGEKFKKEVNKGKK
ncbi:HU family DNA-binding protein [Caminibacter pacificus]|uniref:DNA-binding protein HU-beta n=1 Tax=Caminibacter pacificus TaxID=1424653 RepID=A0AAJ4UWX1_9BACT|nr:HU family DNA-binding protein [Caminibacter pacificus]QDD68171.1 HU family DNA-binding protein [Caminibacter pacificus]ROR38684.1 DNA-binding protein HU-beta [Caminibacter pacificus]